MSEINDDGDGRPLRPVDDTETDSVAWLDSLGLSGSAEPETARQDADTQPAAEESAPTTDTSWLDQLGAGEELSAAAPVGPPPASGSGSTAASGGRRREWLMAGGLSAALVVLLVVLVGVAASRLKPAEETSPNIAEQLDAMSQSASATPTSASPTTAPSMSGPAPWRCEEGTSGDTVTGAGAGDRRSVAGVVLAFEHAYYVDRDAKKALELVSKDSPLVNAKGLQDGIDSMPRDTKHCVSVTTEGSTAQVKLTEVRPAAAPEVFTQRITTTRDGDRIAIVDVTEEGK